MAQSQSRTKQSGYAALPKDKYLSLFTDDLKDIYWVEKKLVSELPKMASKANSPELKRAIEQHLVETERHVQLVEKAFEMIDEKAAGKKCEALVGILDEAKSTLQDVKDDPFLTDVAIIQSAQKVEHYEITSYGNLATVARKLGFPKAAQVMEQILQQEQAADAKLSKVFESIHEELDLE